MYHPKKLVNTAQLALLVSLSVNHIWATTASEAEEHKSRGAQVVSSHQASVESNSYPLIPARRDCRNKPQDIRIYECDTASLGNRTPFLLVHGLRGEYYHGFRWDALIRHFEKNDQFSKRFKLYVVRYDSLASLKQTVPLMKAAISDLYATAARRPLVVMALSIGGNLVYEAMLDRDIDPKVGLLVTLGTPFHGTPLFCPDWFKYSMYKNFQMPWTRIDHAVAYKLYFRRNPNLLTNFGWDNCDNAIPEAGQFASLLPLGPRGNLTVDGTVNKDLLNLPDKSFDRKKLIAYSGYLLNPYLPKGRATQIKSTLMAPYDFCTIELPSHLGREQPVLKMLDRQIAGVRTNEVLANRANTRFVYGLNDGITPLASVFRKKMSAYPASESTPSWMRAPPESFSPITGAPVFSAKSMILQIFSALASDNEPPKTVKSCAKT